MMRSFLRYERHYRDISNKYNDACLCKVLKIGFFCEKYPKSLDIFFFFFVKMTIMRIINKCYLLGRRLFVLEFQ